MDQNAYRVTVRRIDQSYRVMVTMEGLEHTHRHPFGDKNTAWALARRVRGALEEGDDLNLKFWDTEIP